MMFFTNAACWLIRQSVELLISLWHDNLSRRTDHIVLFAAAVRFSQPYMWISYLNTIDIKRDHFLTRLRTRPEPWQWTPRQHVSNSSLDENTICLFLMLLNHQQAQVTNHQSASSKHLNPLGANCAQSNRHFFLEGNNWHCYSFCLRGNVII